MSRSVEFGLAIVVGLTLLSVTGGEFLATVVVMVLLLVSSIVAARFRVSTGGPGVGTDRLATAFAGAWLLLVLGPAHQFSRRAVADAVRAPAFESMLEVCYFSATGVLAVVAVRSVRHDLGSAGLPLAVFALPVFAMVSFLWSPIVFYSFGRGLELVMTAVLAWGTANIGGRDPAFARAVVERFSRWFIRVVIALTLVGLAFGPIYASGSEENLNRFTWIGNHPLGVAWAAGLAVVAVVAVPPEVSRLRGVVRLGALGLVGYATYGAQGRTGLIALGAALAYLLVNAARKSRFARYVSLPYAAAAGAIAAFYFRDEFLGYFYRGQSSDELSSGNGRAELWSDGYRLLKTPFDWAFGLGYGNSREVFLKPDRMWSKSAHSSILGILVNLGLIGITLLAVWLVYMTVMIIKARLHDSQFGNVLVAFALFAVVHAIAAESVSQPGAGNAILMLVTATAVATVRSRAPAQVDDAPDPATTEQARPPGNR
ncbi:MAG: O-antigen ligase family protein [Acidimicrobiales bacterium]|nr:O-antigen ligase family protein [Acidimicrobiales bacterium]